MGLLANLPLALAPGMGLNAYFTFTVVKGMGVPWQVALGAVFLSGVLFLIISLLRVREWLVNAIPMSLKLGIGAGIGLFLGLIGLHEMGLVTGNPETLVTLGHLATPSTLLACLGFLIIAGLTARGMPGAILIGILLTAALGLPFGLTELHGVIAAPPSLAPTFLQARHRRRAVARRHHRRADVLPGRRAGQRRHADRHHAARRADASRRHDRAAARGAAGRQRRRHHRRRCSGPARPPATSRARPASRRAAAPGSPRVTVAVLFLLTLFFAPVATAIPAFATAPALVFVACLMARALRDIDWDDATEYVPAVVLAIGIPFTFSIAAGIGLGFIVYVVVKAAAGRIGAIAGAVWLIAGLSLLKFVLG